MLVAVDGTGPHDDGQYARENRGSFINQLVSEAASKPAYYLRGPGLFGMTCATSAAQVEDLVIAAKKIDSGSPIFLAGHSRGGAIVIAAARRLQAHSISVDAMFLFDAVDRSIAISHTDVIPANVRVAYHALRAPAVGSRTYFGNCGTKSSFSGQMESEHFYSTHAGIGGTPWTGDHPTRMVPDPKRGTGKAPAFRQEPTITKSQDEAGSRRVHGWMWERLARHNVINA